ncbi:MAG: T9SS type A sorting domain-containing protein [bacterium]|nr:T9SS type A sorting domain-containing protein [bacterium]
MKASPASRISHQTLRIVCTAVAIFILWDGKAQSITQSFNEPVVGDVDNLYRLDTSAYTTGIPVNITGTNCVWNFSNLTGTFPMVVDSFIAPGAAAGATAFPTSTYVQHRDPLFTFYKSTVSPQQTELLGAYSPSLSLTFTNSAIIAQYPVSYGYSLSDPVSGSFKYGTTTGACNGNITISCSGLGTAYFPNGNTIQNVLCLKSIEILTLSVGFFPFGTFNQTIINYYMPGKKFPILNVNYSSAGLIAGTPTITATIYGSNNYFSIAGIHESAFNNANFKVYPNPFSEQLFVSDFQKEEECAFSFFDALGKLILNTTSLETEMVKDLPPGVYFLEAKSKSGTYRRKIIKE